MATSSPQRPPSRRRQRSVRVTVAVALLSAATVAVALALPTQSPALLSASSVLALVCGWASARIIWTEVLQTRSQTAAERVNQAQAYRTMFSERAAEHAEFTTSMTERLSVSRRTIRELEATVVLAEKRAIEAELRVQRESRRANDAQEKVAELEEALHIRLAEEADELATWEGFDRDADTIVDLLAWDEKKQSPVDAGAHASGA